MLSVVKDGRAGRDREGKTVEREQWVAQDSPYHPALEPFRSMRASPARPRDVAAAFQELIEFFGGLGVREVPLIIGGRTTSYHRFLH